MTDPLEIATLVDGYRAWLKDRTSVRSVHRDWVQITTPFLDRHNDYIQLYARSRDGAYEITDDGYILRDLEMSGCKLDTPKRQSLLKVTLNGFGVADDSGILSVKASKDNFSFRKHALVQAMLAVNDLFYLAAPTIQSLFKEDVEAWLDDNAIRFIPSLQITGRSGYQHNFDFAIPKTKIKPERIIRAITNPSKDAALLFITAWADTVDQRPHESVAYAFLNDNEKNIAGNVVSALEKYDIKPVLWSARESVKQELAA